MTTAQSALESGLVPVLDLAPLWEGKEGAKEKLVAELGNACTTIGFFAIKGSGIDQEIIDNAWEASREYFDLSTEEKDQCPMADDYPYGYMGYKHEQLSAALGSSRPPDLKESFQVGPDNPLSNSPPRRWPKNPEHFQAAWEAYYEAMNNLASKLLCLSALALGLEETWFEDKIDHHQSALRALNYPVNDEKPEPDQFRASAHTDYGALTILKSGGPGLQVRNVKGEWQDIDATEDMFVVNLGDLMQYWTNGKWVSTLHRVVYLEGDHLERRQSMAFFHNVNHDAVIECIPTCHGPGNPPKNPPITAGEHLLSKHAAASK